MTTDLDAVMADHTFVETIRWFTTTLRCRCGYSRKVWNGLAFQAAKATVQADHWAQEAGIPKYRTIDQIRKGVA
jgi:hypothetical protein